MHQHYIDLIENNDFLINKLFARFTLSIDFPAVYGFEKNASETEKVFFQVKEIYDKERFKNLSEHQLEDEFITKILEILGWEFLRQEDKNIQGKIEKPDFLLFTSKDSKALYESLPEEERKASNEYFSVILESKAYKEEIDTKKILHNPHFQILRYISNLKKDFGFLTNGKLWRFYDNKTLYSQKVFYEINLEKILEKESQAEALEAFNYFYYIFRAKNFEIYQEKSEISDILQKNEEAKITLENDLQAVIYGIEGRDSVFEKIGAAFYERDKNMDLKDIYQYSLYFIFRLLFVAYFEDKFEQTIDKHRYFSKNMSIYNLLGELEKQRQNSKEEERSFNGIYELKRIFENYNKGETNIDIPLFNGGLFDSKNLPEEKLNKVFSNKLLVEILQTLFKYDNGGSIFRRDYSILSVAHLGTIYEGLLSYFFAIAGEELFYVVYSHKKNKDDLESLEGYFEDYDLKNLKKSYIIHRTQTYAKDAIYLKNTSNSRKSTASFYTPDSITKFLCQEAINNASRRGTLNDESLSAKGAKCFKILDNACGSGHFLVEALNCITDFVLDNFDTFPKFKELYNKEKNEIEEGAKEFIEDENYKIDESDILKRLLLKRVIFGVDVNPFSIELTKLSLWIDSFIFGTPLSLIEHHIKCGNALIGSKIEEFEELLEKTAKENVLMPELTKKFNFLQEAAFKLDNITDTNAEKIKKSKEIYSKEIVPNIEVLNLYLNFLNAKFFADKDEKIALLALESEGLQKLEENEYAKEIIQKYAKKFGFFNYEVEFPELVRILADKEKTKITQAQDTKENKAFKGGFDCIVGNPPWDKTKFSDLDFFPQWRSNYRTLSNSKKAELQNDLLKKDYIKKEYEETKDFIKSTNDYYKEKYEKSRGSGDGNLFRFFVERNLELLDKEAILGYVLPSALMLEEGSFALRKHILEQKTLEFFYAFENREGIFHKVDRRYKFALMGIKNKKAHGNCKVKTMFYKTNINEVYKKENLIKLRVTEIKELSPYQLALQEVRSKRDLELLEKCYKAFAPLSLEWLDFRQELNTTGDKKIFLETYKEGLLPLFEGKMFHQFNAEFSEARMFLDPKAFDKRLENKELHRLKQDLGKNLEELENYEEKHLKKFIVYDRNFYRLGYRKIARDTDERTAIFSLIPKNVGCVDNMWESIPKKYELQEDTIGIKTQSLKKLLFALGVFNSLVVDYIVRGMVQINLNKTYISRIPVPQPNEEELANNEDFNFIINSALALQIYNDKEGHFSELKKDFKLETLKTQKDYDILKAKLDIKIAKLYGLNQNDLLYMLESFKVLNEKQGGFVSLLVNEDLWQ